MPTFAHTVLPCKIPRGTQVLSNSEVSEVISSWLDACFSLLLPVRMGFPMFFFSPLFLIVLTAMNGLICESWATWVPCRPRFIIPMGRSYPWRPVAAWDLFVEAVAVIVWNLDMLMVSDTMYISLYIIIYIIIYLYIHIKVIQVCVCNFTLLDIFHPICFLVPHAWW